MMATITTKPDMRDVYFVRDSNWFFQAVKRTAKTVTLRPIQARIMCDGCHWTPEMNHWHRFPYFDDAQNANGKRCAASRPGRLKVADGLYAEPYDWSPVPIRSDF